MVGVIGRREAGDRLATLRETGDFAKIGLYPSGRREILTLCPPMSISNRDIKNKSPRYCIAIGSEEQSDIYLYHYVQRG